MRMDDIVKNLQEELNFGLLFDPKEIHEELVDLDFGHIGFFDIREALCLMRDFSIKVAASQIPDGDGNMAPADAAFVHNSRTYALAARHLQHLLENYKVKLSDDRTVMRLLDLTMRIDLLALEPEAREAHYLRKRPQHD